jgi:hypothetical protein
MKLRARHLLQVTLTGVLLLVATSAAERVQVATSHDRFRGSATQLVTSQGEFDPFARKVAADVDAALRETAPTNVARLKLLLGLRVHLALHFRDDATALATAERIRELQIDPGERALAGVTTRAIVAAQHDPRRFEQEFSTLLATLPRDAGVRAALQRARDKISGLNQETLLNEVRTQIEPQLARGEPCTLEIADQLVRIRHRLTDILPLRDALLRAYDAAVAARS